MSVPRYDDIEAGFELPSLMLPPTTRQQLAIYCGASGDHNPVHVDIDFARASGLDDVIAHGMLVMAYTGRVVTDWVPQHCIRAFDTRFMAMTHIGDAITARGRVTDKLVEADERRVRIALEARDQHDEIKTTGSVLVALP